MPQASSFMALVLLSATQLSWVLLQLSTVAGHKVRCHERSM